MTNPCAGRKAVPAPLPRGCSCRREKWRPRSSPDLPTRWPILNERAELVFTFADIFNDSAVEQEVDGHGFTAVYQNFLETQVATVGIRIRF